MIRNGGATSAIGLPIAPAKIPACVVQLIDNRLLEYDSYTSDRVSHQRVLDGPVPPLPTRVPLISALQSKPKATWRPPENHG